MTKVVGGCAIRCTAVSAQPIRKNGRNTKRCHTSSLPFFEPFFCFGKIFFVLFDHQETRLPHFAGTGYVRNNPRKSGVRSLPNSARLVYRHERGIPLGVRRCDGGLTGDAALCVDVRCLLLLTAYFCIGGFRNSKMLYGWRKRFCRRICASGDHLY